MTLYKDSVKYFGGLGLRHFSGYFSPLKEELKKANMNVLFETYVGRMVYLSVAAFVVTFGAVATAFTFLNVNILFSIFGAAIAAGATAFAVMTVYHSYPYHLLTSKKNSINSNMPFAINHMGAISASGVPPFVIFKLLANIHEYGEIAKEAKRIVRNIEIFGMDITTAIKNVASRTPSPDFKQFLSGVIANIETGGDLRTYLDNTAKEALFDYKLRREKYLKTLETYADFYTAVLIAAPLFFVSTLSILSLVGGQIFGLSIPVAIQLGVYIFMPMLNIAFIMFIHYTQPKS